MPTNNSKGNEAALAVKLAAGTQKHFSTVPQLIVGGATFTPAEVEAQLLAFATLRSDVESAKAVVQAKLEDEKVKGPALRVFLIAFEGIVRSAFGGSPDVLADFGLQPRKGKKPRTAEQLAAAKAKREATRKARGTLGKRKKLAIKGDVTGVTVTPVTAAATPQPLVSTGPSVPPNGGH